MQEQEAAGHGRTHENTAAFAARLKRCNSGIEHLAAHPRPRP
ncbi:hypothetical protein ACFYSH_15940 [Streptomyces sp. NPDC005791]